MEQKSMNGKAQRGICPPNPPSPKILQSAGVFERKNSKKFLV